MNPIFYLNGNPVTHETAENLIGADRLDNLTGYAQRAYAANGTDGYWFENDPQAAYKVQLAGEPLPDNSFTAPDDAILTICFETPA